MIFTLKSKNVAKQFLKNKNVPEPVRNHYIRQYYKKKQRNIPLKMLGLSCYLSLVLIGIFYLFTLFIKRKPFNKYIQKHTKQSLKMAGILTVILILSTVLTSLNSCIIFLLSGYNKIYSELIAFLPEIIFVSILFIGIRGIFFSKR